MVSSRKRKKYLTTNKLVKKVLEGGTGVRGNVAMPATKPLASLKRMFGNW